MGEAARLVDPLAHRHAGGRWLATGGGGYDAYRVVPRAWALTWLAGAHREVPASTPPAWRERWASEAARFGQAPLPETFDDVPGVGRGGRYRAGHRGRPDDRAWRPSSGARSCRGSCARPSIAAGGRPMTASPPPGADPMPRTPLPAAGHAAVLDTMDRAIWSGLTLAPRVIAPADPALAHAIVAAALDDGGARDRRGPGQHGRRAGRSWTGRVGSCWRSGSRPAWRRAGARARPARRRAGPAGWIGGRRRGVDGGARRHRTDGSDGAGGVGATTARRAPASTSCRRTNDLQADRSRCCSRWSAPGRGARAATAGADDRTPARARPRRCPAARRPSMPAAARSAGSGPARSRPRSTRSSRSACSISVSARGWSATTRSVAATRPS